MNGWLFDENVPLPKNLATALPWQHATALGKSLTDTFLWQYARQHRLAIVTKDADFSQRIMLADPPPWIVRLKFGNLRKQDFLAALNRLLPYVEQRLPSCRLVNVFADWLEAVQ